MRQPSGALGVANLQRAQAFLQAFLERAANGHRFAHAFHLRGERGVGLREFLEGEARNLGDDVINARLEARPVRERPCRKREPCANILSRGERGFRA